MRRTQTATILLLASAAPCAAQPAIVSGAIATPVVDVTRPPGSPTIDLVITGKAAIIGFLLQGPSGEFASQDFIYHAGFPAHARLRGYIPSQFGTNTTPNQAFSLYTEAGTWTLVTGEICDANYNCSYYDAAQLAALFPTATFTIKNPNKPDFSPPVLTQGDIKTPNVTAGGAKPLKITLSGTDDVSGVVSASFCATLSGTSTQICATSDPFYDPSRKAAVTVRDQLPADNTPGTYTINIARLIDAADNYATYANPGELNAIFSNNVTVTVTP
jgi:hypothetical protein